MLLVILFLVGAGLLAYPAISNYLSSRQQSKVIDGYKNQISKMTSEELSQALKDAQEYNQTLIGNVVLKDPFDFEAVQEQNQAYNQLINLNNDSMMGYLNIPSVNVYIAIYHGTDAEILQKGAGHLLNSSLPVGGQGTHAVISAHSGLPTAKYFTDLNQLKKGDLFYLEVLDQTLTYEINQIKVVNPQDIKDLYIDIQQDYVTLVTCTPYGINSHRLLVRGVRTADNSTQENKSPAVIQSQGNYWWLDKYIFLIPFVILAIIKVWVIYKRRVRDSV